MKKILMVLMIFGGLGLAHDQHTSQSAIETFFNVNLSKRVELILEFSEHNHLSDRSTEYLLVLTYEFQNDREAFTEGIQQLFSDMGASKPSISDDGSYICIGSDGTLIDIPIVHPDYPWNYCLICSFLGGRCYYDCPVCNANDAP
ncbi:hypothetical protein SCOR_00590 [Sulfidibacter corallicola]|uniref:Uncharacterized protein n=1 Tax=Sulfidibacter corallicola TaxID=2818388 RepID=A0A8A4TGD3_SULCO|nr:hypothetical protein [Sulfidibacter corallicola]QTD48976.1 hypothetical protein J3U87_25610 [Sulfidibacter corallicola]